MANQVKISKIKLSNGRVYSIYDNNAVHYSPDGKLRVDNAEINDLIIRDNLQIVELDDTTVEEFLEANLLVEENGMVKKHSTNNLLEDIGGYSANVSDGTLSLKLGKQ